MSLSPHPLCIHALPSRKQNRERIASKTPVFQIVIVTLQSQMTSALCLCRFQQPQALRSFLPRYPSNAYDQVTSSFSGEYSRIVFCVIKFRWRMSNNKLARDQISMTHEQQQAGVWSNFDDTWAFLPLKWSNFDDARATTSWRVIKFCSRVIEFWWHTSFFTSRVIEFWWRTSFFISRVIKFWWRMRF